MSLVFVDVVQWPYGPHDYGPSCDATKFLVRRKEDFCAGRTFGPNRFFRPTTIRFRLHIATPRCPPGRPPHSSGDKALRFRPSASAPSPLVSSPARAAQSTSPRSDTAATPASPRPSPADAEPMVAPATLALRPSAAPAPPRAALPRARAWFAPAIRTSPSVAASYPPRRFSGVRRAVAVDADQQGSPEPPEQV